MMLINTLLKSDFNYVMRSDLRKLKICTDYSLCHPYKILKHTILCYFCFLFCFSFPELMRAGSRSCAYDLNIVFDVSCEN